LIGGAPVLHYRAATGYENHWKIKPGNQTNQNAMPRGGYRPNAGRKKGSFGKLTVGHEAPRPDFDSLEQLRMIAKKFLGQAAAEQRKAEGMNVKFFNECLLNAHRVLRDICPYDHAKLVSVTSDSGGTRSTVSPQVAMRQSRPSRPSLHHDPLDLDLRESLLGAVVDLGGARAFVRRHRLRVLQRAPVGEIRRDAGRAERVVADRCNDAGGECALAHHAPGIDPTVKGLKRSSMVARCSMAEWRYSMTCDRV
jgi:hypothetical protein